jgi:hypothetical protein
MGASQRAQSVVVDSDASPDPISPLPWEVRVWWRPADGVACPEFTTFGAEDEDGAIDEAVSVMDGCRHRRALVMAVRAEIRPAGFEGRWRTVAAAHVRSYL